MCLMVDMVVTGCAGALQVGDTALVKAACMEHEAVVRVLVDAGADKDLQNKVGWARIGS